MQQNAQVNHRDFLLAQINVDYFCLVTAPVEVYAPKSKPQASSPIETHEKAISPIFIPSTGVIDENAEAILSRLSMTDDNMAMIKATYDDKIAQIHENYQYIIDQFIFFSDKYPYI